MEDAASVLEQFVQDVANLPAEIAHLLEEVQAKEVIIQECLKNISRCDNSLQKFYKASGPLTAHPKEDVYCKQVEQHYARAQKLQEEKVALSEKAGVLLDRHVKRLDIKIRDLQADGSITIDPQLPSLLHHNTANRASISSTPTGTSTPLNNLHHNAQPSTTIANNPALRLPHPMIVQQARPNATPANILSNPLIPAHLVSSNPTSPAASGQFNRRDSNASLSDTSKKRKLNPTQANQAAPSNLKQTTLTNLAIPNNKPSSGPGSRGSSAGPRSKKTSTGGPKKLAPHQAAAARKSGKPGSTNLKALHHKRALKQALGAANGRGIKGSASGSQSAEESESGAESGSESEDAAGAGRAPPPPDTSKEAVREDEEMEDVGETEGDDRKYCICQTVSHGDMVACDNEECPNEWFHWECVGLTKEPVGKWFCPDCRKKLGAPGRS